MADVVLGEAEGAGEDEAFDDRRVEVPVGLREVGERAVGDRLVLRTSPIVDRNGNRVPDGTPVEFTVMFLSENLQTRQTSAAAPLPKPVAQHPQWERPLQRLDRRVLGVGQHAPRAAPVSGERR